MSDGEDAVWIMAANFALPLCHELVVLANAFTAALTETSVCQAAAESTTSRASWAPAWQSSGSFSQNWR